MANPTHSPLPWKRGTDGLIFDADNEYVTDTCGTSLPGGEENQKLIVHAVNNHDALLKGLRETMRGIDTILWLAQQHDPTTGRRQLYISPWPILAALPSTICIKAREALTKAEGKPSP